MIVGISKTAIDPEKLFFRNTKQIKGLAFGFIPASVMNRFGLCNMMSN
jgi:hypothetical protein